MKYFILFYKIYNFAFAELLQNVYIYCKKMIIYLSQSIGHHLLVLYPIFAAATEFRVEGTGHVLKRSTNRFYFGFFHKTRSAGLSSRVQSIEIAVIQRE